MDAQEQHDLKLKNAKVTKGSRKRVEDLLRASERSSSVVLQPSTQNQIAVMAALFGAIPARLAEDAEEMGF